MRKRRTDINQSPLTFPVVLTQARRRLVAELIPDLADRLKIDRATSRTIRFTPEELQEIGAKCKAATPEKTHKTRNVLERVAEAATHALERSEQGDISQIPASERIYQFKMTLKGTAPPIWRRIQIKACTLDKLHEHIQTAMSWTNSHLHRFWIDGVLYGDPVLIHDGWLGNEPLVDSLRTKVSTIFPASGKRFRFEYEYGKWKHDILFEGCLRAEKGTRYPLCLEGERACPPDDVGGLDGYEKFLEAFAEPDADEENSCLNALFDAEAFDAGEATEAMQKGLPNDWQLG